MSRYVQSARGAKGGVSMKLEQQTSWRAGQGIGGCVVRRVALVCVALLAISGAGCDPTPVEHEDTKIALDLSTDPVTLQFITISEWGAAIDPLGSGDQQYAGAEVLAAYWEQDRAAHPGRTLVMSNGDAFGISPPLSSLLEETPAIIALNLMGLDIDTFGNHNFDRGLAHLQAKIDESEYTWVAANFTNVPQNLQGVAPYTIRNVGGVPVAVIGIVDPAAPDLVFPGSFGTMSVTDPVEAALEARAMAAAAGAKVFVAMVHLYANASEDDDGNLVVDGALIDFALEVQGRSNGGFHLIAGGSARPSFLCGVMQGGLARCATRAIAELPPVGTVDPMRPATILLAPDERPVLLTRNEGRVYARTTITVIPATGEVLDQSVTFVHPWAASVTTSGTIDAAMEAFRTELAVVLDERLVTVSAPFLYDDGGASSPNDARHHQTPLGTLLTDALRIATESELAVINSGSIRDSMPSQYEVLDPSLQRDAPDYDVVVGDVHKALPFANLIETIKVDGTALWEMAEHCVVSRGSGAFLHISGFRIYETLDATGAPEVCALTLDDGTPIERNDSHAWTLTTNTYLAQGGDDYIMLADNPGVVGQLVSAAVISHLRTLEGPLSPESFAEERLVRVESGSPCPPQ